MYANKIRFNKFIVTNYQTVKGMKFTGIKNFSSDFLDTANVNAYILKRNIKVVKKYNEVKELYNKNHNEHNKKLLEGETIKKHSLIEVAGNNDDNLYATIKSINKKKNITIYDSADGSLNTFDLNEDKPYSEFFKLSKKSEISLKNSDEFKKVDIFTSKKNIMQNFRKEINCETEQEFKDQLLVDAEILSDVELNIDFKVD